MVFTYLPHQDISITLATYTYRKVRHREVISVVLSLELVYQLHHWATVKQAAYESIMSNSSLQKGTFENCLTGKIAESKTKLTQDQGSQ